MQFFSANHYNIRNTSLMNTQELWQRYQEWLYFNEDLGFYLDISRMRFDERLLAALEQKFAQAFKDMIALELRCNR
jgi:glucose-6-phosphate isomerase